MSPSDSEHRASVKATILDTLQTLLKELGSGHATQHASLNASLDKDLGLGSLERVEMLVRIEASLKTRLPDTLAQTAETPADWVRAVLEAGGDHHPRERWPIIQPAREAGEPPHAARSFKEVLQLHAERDPARVHIHLLEQDLGQDISYGQLYASASQVAAGLIASGLKPGETVAIMLPTCTDFFSSFLGVMLAGGIAVPVYPPARANQIEEYIQRQALILGNAGIRFLISFERIQAVSNVLARSLLSLQEVVTSRTLQERGRNTVLGDINPSDVFFIQYTSGSTGNPKGVTLSHANVLANIRGIGHGVQAVPSDVVVTWLPLYHDMGLIGSWLFSLYYGFPITILSPLDFLTRPERWLWALSDSGGTLCPAPNFAFELCVRKISDEAMEGVNLSKWRVAINAGEPVLSPTLERFTKRFSPWGFSPRSYIPCYGLAESSVALTFPSLTEEPTIDRIDRIEFETTGTATPTSSKEVNQILEFVSNGVVLPGHELLLIDDTGKGVAERTRGKILFRGPSRTNGYFRNPQATRAAINTDGWMDSGDLGYLADNELFVTGRLKDCIIKSGRNITPQDVEMAVWEVEGVRKGCVAAFGNLDSQTGTENLVVVAETRTTYEREKHRIEAEVTEVITRKIGLPPDEILLTGPGMILKTSSGKIQRSATHQLYLKNALAGRSQTAPWLQMARVWLRSFSGVTTSAFTHLGSMLQRSTLSLTRTAVGVTFGMLARLAPSPTAARFVVKPGACLLAALSGLRTSGELGQKDACLLLVNRTHRLDALAVACTSRSGFVFADHSSFATLGALEAFLLEPMVAINVQERQSQGSNPLEKTILEYLNSGLSVVCFSDNPVGESPERTRFRAENFAVASSLNIPVVPVNLHDNGDGCLESIASEPLEQQATSNGLGSVREAVRTSLNQTKLRQCQR